MTGERPSDWISWLSLAEWWYNTTHHTSIHSSPYTTLYGQDPPLHQPYLAGSSLMAIVDRSMQARETARQLLRFHFKGSQARMKQLADKKRSDREF
ncbi:hypothetical protein V6Z11_D04G119100 [Gossypium hirsutum]